MGNSVHLLFCKGRSALFALVAYGLCCLIVGGAFGYLGGQASCKAARSGTQKDAQTQVQLTAAPIAAEDLPIFSVERNTKQVAITFDMAWEGTDLQRLLDILADKKVTATFFVVGEYAAQYPDEMKALVKAGHEIGNHSYHHPHVAVCDSGKIRTDLDQCNQLLEKLTGKKITLYRSPYGEFNATVTRTVRQAGLLPIQWSVDSIDWKNPTADEICKRVLGKAKPGDILLFHTGKENTLAAIGPVLDGLKKMGLEPVTVGKLIYPDSYTMDSEGRQHPAVKTGLVVSQAEKQNG